MSKFGNPENLSPEQMVTKYNFCHRVPYWNIREDFSTIVRSYWEDNQFQLDLPPNEDKKEALKLIDNTFGLACYATIRPICVAEGTRDWLSNHCLLQANMFMRPATLAFEDADSAKVSTICSLFPNVVGLIDDSSKVVNKFPSDYRGTVLHFGAIEQERNDINVIPCPTWSDVIYEVNQLSNINPEIKP